MIRNLAIKMLARREHSKLELLHKLVAKGFTANLVTPVLDALEQQGLQNDTRFAEMYVRTRASHGFGPVRIQAELSEHGISESIIKAILFSADYVWLDFAKQVRAKKYGTKIPRDFTLQIEQKRYLQYKGFDFDTIKHIFTHE